MSLNTAGVATRREQAVWHGLLAHDLKNALGLLEGQLEQLTRQPTAADAASAHRQCRALRQRLVMMLTVSRAHAADRPDPDHGLQTWVTDEDPLALLQAVALNAAAFRPELQIQVVVAVGAPTFWTYDAHLVRMAMDAAMNNALRFANTCIELRIAARNHGLSLQVADDGPGLGGEPNWTPPGVGLRSTGIGMALCQAVGRAHACAGREGAANLDAAATAPAMAGTHALGGTLFELWLP